MAVPRPAHLVTAAACAVFSLVLLLVLPVVAADDPSLGSAPSPGGPGWWAVTAVLLAQAVLVAFVARAPAVVLPLITGLPVALVWAEPGSVFTLTAIAEIAAVFVAVVARPLRGWWPYLVLAGVLLAAGQFGSSVRTGVDVGTAAVGGAGQALVVLGLPLLLGSTLAAQRAAAEARRHEVRALRREQDALLQAVTARERAAMSRELHDIAAHHMSGIAVLAAAMGRQVDTDPAAAKRSAAQVREQSRAVLDDLRRLVGLLRSDADVNRPVATLATIATLVEGHRATGAEVALHLPEDLPEPGPLAQLVAHRTVQESLTNAAVHAPGAPCTVRVEALPDGGVGLSVRNGRATGPDPGPGSGFGLLGMAERARLVGAGLVHGPTADGGWEVGLRLPPPDVVGTVPAVPPSSGKDTA
ncbi:sensor histidine kinase [Pseudonocardia sp. HH130630-07]|uniref:sensor histidine kinase n=1 Tax=Pseudonocardia sp. HH130630-07 TaxID=1690815 RepID=UPI000814BB00|nr:histidine kinase [Pseudonocardia sp. HH130630-07]ANY09429.1 hypothetical protein AFB00_27895 [Pseudonocardia sp. HH130630-07]